MKPLRAGLTPADGPYWTKDKVDLRQRLVALRLQYGDAAFNAALEKLMIVEMPQADAESSAGRS
jgi:hypothetical protein